MNTLNKYIFSGLAAAVLAGISGQVALAADATGNASANVLAPLTLTQAAGGDMQFGDVAGDNTLATTVVLTTGGVASSGDGAYVANNGQAGTFNVTGGANLGYTIALPAAAITLNDGGANNMTVDTFTHSYGVGPGTLDGTGNDSFTVGATLNIGAAQPAGLYQGTYTVTVDYQ
jgi:hypothetical protein